MGKIAETGHAKNVANFKALTAQVSEMGARYNPSADSIRLSALTTRGIQADQVMSALIKAGSLADNTTNKRIEQFAKISKLITRISATLKMARVSPETMDDAAGFIAKLRGKRRGKPADTSLPSPSSSTIAEPVHHPTTKSVSQRSFDMQQAAFGELVAFIEAQPHYKSNDAALTKEGLNDFLVGLDAANTEAIVVNNTYRQAQQTRNMELYDRQNGLFTIVSEVKAYLKSLPDGINSPDYKNAVKFQFKSFY